MSKVHAKVVGLNISYNYFKQASHVSIAQRTKWMQQLLFFVLCGFYLALAFYVIFPQKCYKIKLQHESIKNYRLSATNFCSNFNRLFNKFSNLKRWTSQHESCRYPLCLSVRYMKRLFWIKEVRHIGHEIHISQKFWDHNHV